MKHVRVAQISTEVPAFMFIAVLIKALNCIYYEPHESSSHPHTMYV